MCSNWFVYIDFVQTKIYLQLCVNGGLCLYVWVMLKLKCCSKFTFNQFIKTSVYTQQITDITVHNLNITKRQSYLENLTHVSIQYYIFLLWKLLVGWVPKKYKTLQKPTCSGFVLRETRARATTIKHKTTDQDKFGREKYFPEQNNNGQLPFQYMLLDHYC